MQTQPATIQPINCYIFQNTPGEYDPKKCDSVIATSYEEAVQKRQDFNKWFLKQIIKNI